MYIHREANFCWLAAILKLHEQLLAGTVGVRGKYNICPSTSAMHRTELHYALRTTWMLMWRVQNIFQASSKMVSVPEALTSLRHRDSLSSHHNRDQRVSCMIATVRPISWRCSAQKLAERKNVSLGKTELPTKMPCNYDGFDWFSDGYCLAGNFAKLNMLNNSRSMEVVPRPNFIKLLSLIFCIYFA